MWSGVVWRASIIAGEQVVKFRLCKLAIDQNSSSRTSDCKHIARASQTNDSTRTRTVQIQTTNTEMTTCHNHGFVGEGTNGGIALGGAIVCG